MLRKRKEKTKDEKKGVKGCAEATATPKDSKCAPPFAKIQPIPH